MTTSRKGRLCFDSEKVRKIQIMADLHRRATGRLERRWNWRKWRHEWRLVDRLGNVIDDWGEA